MTAEKSIFELRKSSVETKHGNIPLQFLVCGPLEEAGFLNAFSTRMGGVSPMPKDSLHLSWKDDSENHIRENRRRFLSAINAVGIPLVTPHQTHSAVASEIEPNIFYSDSPVDHIEPEADALFTRLEHLLIGIKTADCVPILLADSKSGVMGAVHAGWRGVKGLIIQETIRKMKSQALVEPQNLMAALGPCICSSCYEVGADVAEGLQSLFGLKSYVVAPSARDPKKFSVDLRRAVVRQLLDTGLNQNQIFADDHCTAHQNDLFFSHRRESLNNKHKVGRLLSVIGRIRP